MRVLFAAAAGIAAAVAASQADALPFGSKPLLRGGDGEDFPQPGACVKPAVCTAPDHAQHSRVMQVGSRSQWEDNGGYCGSLSVQAIAMNFGAYISQDKARCRPRAPYSLLLQ